jgi:hypothetical protein
MAGGQNEEGMKADQRRPNQPKEGETLRPPAVPKAHDVQTSKF